MSEHNPSGLTAQLIARAWKDEPFKEELLRDPKGVLGRELAQLAPGATLPEQVQIHVVEETPTHRYLVLPLNPRIESGEELADAELQQVASAGTRIATRRFDDDTHCYGF